MTDTHGTPLRPGDIVLVENEALDLREYGVVRRSSETPDGFDGPDAPKIEWLSRPYLNPDPAYWLGRAALTVTGSAADGVPPHMLRPEYCKNADT